MIRAHMETRNFTFEAYGETEAEALAVMKRGWTRHRKQYGGAARVGPFSEFSDGVSFIEIQPGKAYRDHEELK